MAKWGEITILKKRQEERDILSVKYFMEGKQIAASCADGLVRFYDTETLELKRSLGSISDDPSDPTIPVTSVTAIPNQKGGSELCVASYTDGYLKVWDIDKQTILKSINEDRQLFSVICHPSEASFLSVGDDGLIMLYDNETLNVVTEFKSSNTRGKVDGHTSRVFTATFHPKNMSEFLSGGWDNAILYWDTRTPHSTRYFAGPHICGEGIDIKANGKEILTSAYQRDNMSQMWDYGSGKLLFNYEVDAFKSMLYCGKWLEEEYFATGGSEPSLFRVVSLRNMSTIAYYRSQMSGVYSFDFKPFGGTGLGANTSSATVVPKPPGAKDGQMDAPIVRVVFCAGRTLFEADCRLFTK